MGMAVPHTLCSVKSVGIAVEMNVYEPHLLGGIVAHMIGHNIGMLHDDGREECYCKDWHGCIMAQSIIGLNNVLPYKFSECSAKEYMDVLRLGEAMCLLNKPNEVGSYPHTPREDRPDFLIKNANPSLFLKLQNFTKPTSF